VKKFQIYFTELSTQMGRWWGRSFKIMISSDRIETAGGFRLLLMAELTPWTI